MRPPAKPGAYSQGRYAELLEQNRSLAEENTALRQQVIVLQRTVESQRRRIEARKVPLLSASRWAKARYSGGALARAVEPPWLRPSLELLGWSAALAQGERSVRYTLLAPEARFGLRAVAPGLHQHLEGRHVAQEGTAAVGCEA